jgi:hypothetical protein
VVSVVVVGYILDHYCSRFAIEKFDKAMTKRKRTKRQTMIHTIENNKHCATPTPQNTEVCS